MLLAIACVMPLVCLGAFRVWLDYRVALQRTDDGLLAIANSVALTVERELQLEIRALETLALSSALQTPDFPGFDRQAAAFLANLPPGAMLAVINPDLTLRQIYGAPDNSAVAEILHRVVIHGPRVFQTHQPEISDLRRSRLLGVPVFNIDVPVMQAGQVVYDLSICLPASALQHLLARQYLPPNSVLSVADTKGVIVARIPNASLYAGRPMVPTLWPRVNGQPQGVTQAPTLEGVRALAAFTHVTQFGWAVMVGAPESVVHSELRAALIRLAESGIAVLAAAALFGAIAARGITRPIERLQQLAARDDRIIPDHPVATGLAEVDVAARALVKAAAERRAAAADLAESEQRFRALFERAGHGTILIDPDSLAIVDCNESAAGFLGYKVEEFRGCLISDFAVSSTPDDIRRMAGAVLDGNSWQYETQVSGRTGRRDLLNAVAPVQVSGRTLILVNQIDVTELRQAEAGLRISNERLDLARQGASLGIWDWHVTTDILSWSEHQWFLHGVEPRSEGPTSGLWRECIHPADAVRVQAEIAAAVKTAGQSFATEYSVRLPGGGIRRLLARGQSVRGEDGRVTRMVGINMDVTARYEAESARDQLIWLLETERSRLSEIIEALPIGVGIVDAEGHVVLGNTRMRALAGPVIHSMSPNPTSEWIAFENGSPAPMEDYPIRRALRHGETCLPGREFLHRDETGRETWFRVGALPLRRENDQVLEALAIFQDNDAEHRLIEVQQQVNARLEQRVREEMAAREAAQQRAAHAERMQALGQIAGGIAHDFNNVLQAVSGGAALIERRPDDPGRVLRNAKMVLDASRRGAAITSRLLAFARRGDLRAETINTRALLTDMAEVLTHTLGGSVVCHVEAASHVPPLFADRGQLETVLVNLATNARDAMPLGGTLTLSAGTETVSPGRPHAAGLAAGSYIRIAVSDTGSGMDGTVLARVTEPFFTTKAPGKGTGLGLAMAKGFAEQSGGSLSIESALGHGTKVTLWLPSAMGEASGIGGPAERGGPGGDRQAVLLVDDDAIVLDVLRLSLDDAGYDVHAVENGVAALDWLTEGKRVDIIVSDLTMPGMDGVALIRAVHERRPSLPAVLLTGYAGDGATLAVGGAITGTFSLLRKPVSGTQLVERISVLLEAYAPAGAG